ncbi:MAG: ABC transporter permease, partial [Mesorhizobium sp.]
VRNALGPELAGPFAAFVAVMIVFGFAAPNFLSRATFGSVAFQLPELGLLTLAMLLPILTGGLNLAITFTANMAGLTLAWVLQSQGGGYGSIIGIPVPLLIFIACVLIWHVLLTRMKLGFNTYMIGSNIEATRYSGINTRKVQVLVYTLSGAMCAVAGIIMLARFNSVRVGHGESYLLITVLACFLGGVNPFGGFGRVIPVFVALVVLQLLSSGLNLMGASQHLATAVWGILMITVMILRWLAGRLKFLNTNRG